MVKLNTYTPIRKGPTLQELDQQVKDAAQAMEGKFLEEMMKQMRSTVHESEGFIPTSQAEKIFREQLDQQYVGQWSSKGGLGLADMIYQQIMDKYGEKMGLRVPQQKPQGPLPIQPRIQKTIPAPSESGSPDQLSPVQLKNNKLTFIYDLQKMSLGEEGSSLETEPPSREVQSPWSGKLSRVQSIGTDETLVELDHEGGLRSQLVFKGRTDIKSGQQIESGQKLGVLSPEAKSLFWTLDVPASV